MGRPTQIPETSELAPLIAAAGGVVALANAMGVARLTIYRIGMGKVPPSALVQRAANDYASKAKLRLPYPIE